MTNTEHTLSKTNEESGYKTLYVFTPKGTTVEVARYHGSTEDERHHSEGWGAYGKTSRTLTTAAARAEYRALQTQGYSARGW